MLDGHFLDPADEAENYENDFVMVYCPKCQGKIEFPIIHPNANGSWYQAINIPAGIALGMKWNPNDVHCDQCNLPLDIERVYEQPKRVELRVTPHIPNPIYNPIMNWFDELGGRYLL